MTTQAASVLCLGNISIDESIYLDGSRSLATGGDAVYAALGALLVSGDVRMCAPVGRDPDASTLLELAAVGLDVAALPRRELPTLRHTIVHRSDGGRDWISSASDAEFDVLSPSTADLSPADLAVDGVLLCAMGLHAQVALSHHLAATKTAMTYLDLREDYLDERGDLFTMVAEADVFLPSEIEATTLAGTSKVAVAAEFLAALGPRTVVIKRGASGCHVYAGGGHLDVPAAAADVVDTTGAGDAFCGAFAAAHAIGGDALAAARTAVRVAAVAVSGLGTSALLAAVAAARGSAVSA